MYDAQNLSLAVIAYVCRWSVRLSGSRSENKKLVAFAHQFVAQSLAAETGRWFPWSLNSYDAQALNALFDSRTFFGWGTGPQRYTIKKMHGILLSQGMATPSDPVATLQMVRSMGLVGTSPAETMDKIFAWSRTNLKHFYGSETPENNLAHWGFRGYPPILNILEGTNRQITGGGTEFGHWTAGCWGSTAFREACGEDAQYSC